MGDTSLLIAGLAEAARFAGAVRRFAAAEAGCRVSLDRALRVVGGVREPDDYEPLERVVPASPMAAVP